MVGAPVLALEEDALLGRAELDGHVKGVDIADVDRLKPNRDGSAGEAV